MKFRKFIVKTDTELTDVVRFIEESDGEAVLLTFTGEHDLLVSPVTIRFIQKSAVLANTPVVFQIVHNNIGKSLAEEEGVITYDGTDSVPEDLWTKAANLNKRLGEERKAKLKGVDQSQKTAIPQSMTDNSAENAATSTAESESDTEDPENEFIGSKELERSIRLTGHNDHHDFQDKVEEAIRKAKAIQHGKSEDIEPKVVREGSVEIDLAPAGRDDQASLLDMDFSGTRMTKNTHMPNDGVSEQGGEHLTSSSLVARHSIRKFPIPDMARFGKIFNKRLLTKLLIFAIVTLSVAGYLAYILMPKAHVSLQVSGYKIDISQEFTGDKSVQSMDMVNKKIRVREEVVELSRSGTAPTTGTGVDGQKATGSIRVYQDGADPITVPAGTTVIANEGGYQYKTVNTYVVQPGQSETISVEAVDIGDEYNVPAGTHFTIEGFDQFNSAKAYVSFAGGEKREFKAVAQDDIDKLAKDLQKSAFDEADAKIREKERDGWVLVAETVKHTLDGDVSTDKQVGAEADVVNVDISTKSSALFYNERDLLDQRDKLVQEYIDSLGSQSSEGFSWDLSQGIDAKMVLESVRDGVVKVKYSITGELQPVVDRQVIREELAGVS